MAPDRLRRRICRASAGSSARLAARCAPALPRRPPAPPRSTSIAVSAGVGWTPAGRRRAGRHPARPAPSTSAATASSKARGATRTPRAERRAAARRPAPASSTSTGASGCSAARRSTAPGPRRSRAGGPRRRPALRVQPRAQPRPLAALGRADDAHAQDPALGRAARRPRCRAGSPSAPARRDESAGQRRAHGRRCGRDAGRPRRPARRAARSRSRAARRHPTAATRTSPGPRGGQQPHGSG